MKTTILLLMLLTSACSGLKHATTLPAFEPRNVCSASALEHYDAKLEKYHNSELFTSQIHTEVSDIHEFIKRCHSLEVFRTDNLTPFNLCFIFLTDSSGQITYSNFHTNDIKVTDDFYSCLEDTVKDLDTRSFQNAAHVQGFGLLLQ